MKKRNLAIPVEVHDEFRVICAKKKMRLGELATRIIKAWLKKQR